MNGRELSEKFFTECGLPAFSESFPDIMPFLCFALTGPGSECYGFDDELSQDHDFEPGFCIFYPENVLDQKQVFKLERAYSKLPDNFCGYSRQKIAPYGGNNRRGVMGIAEFFRRYIPSSCYPPDNIEKWAAIKEEALAEATNGFIFKDNYGSFSNLRQYLAVPPSDIRLKRLSGLLFRLSQSAGYNIPRMIKRGQNGAARLYLAEAAEDFLSCIFLLTENYRPYKKWLFKGAEKTLYGLRSGEVKRDLPDGLIDRCENIFRVTGLILNDSTIKEAARLSAELCEVLADAVNLKFGTLSGGNDIQKTAFELNNKIKDHYLRNSEIMMLV